MKAALSIRKASANDIQDILNIENESFDRDGFSRSQFLYLITRSKGAFYVATIGDMVVGYICLLSHADRKNIRIYSIAVVPGHRGKGVAGALISKAREFAIDENSNGVSLEVRVDNLSAIRFYEKNGFRIVSIKKQYYSDLTDAFYMQLAID